MKEKILWLLVITLSGVLLLAASNGIPSLGLGHARHENRTQFLKKHRTNRTTVQIDSFSVGTIGGNPADTLWSIRGTRKDTSVVSPSWPYFSHRFCFDDTTSDDSISIKFKLYMGSRSERFSTNRSYPPPFGLTFRANYWVLVDSITVTGHQPAFKVWTGSPIPSAPWYYLVAEGQAANSKVTPAVGTIVTDYWDELPK